MLTDRSVGRLTAWLRHRTDIEIVCRDRAGAYADVKGQSDRMRDVTGRAAMWSPGAPGLPRLVEWLFRDKITEGMLPGKAMPK
ncbi:hypothetical protein [Nocardia farcinica]|uniref:hypothetical protein n=1 Tax=Nocardia farcinica TaxID=37329 RepID=UPI001894DF2F|nr:hypothetical protein [Nocardia farcinica]MBF6271636.1 hypothetical protein [Nocardia farcinica]MCZ9330357.1 hypothetical protein [Nocardia farcinica]